MQLAQYVATIANDGKRVAPHLVQGIYENDAKGGLGPLKEDVYKRQDETLELFEVTLAEAEELIQRGDICDAKTIMAIQYWKHLQNK